MVVIKIQYIKAHEGSLCHKEGFLLPLLNYVKVMDFCTAWNRQKMLFTKWPSLPSDF